MSQTYFEQILVIDDRLGAITDKIKYAVHQGGQNVVSQSYKAISESPSSQFFNINVPNLETICDRTVLWSSTVTLKISTTATRTAAANVLGITPNEYLVNYGVTDALSAFPLHSLTNTMSATINNNTVTTNMQDALPLILRMLDPEEMAKYEGYTPTTLDFLGEYRDAVDRLEYVFLLLLLEQTQIRNALRSTFLVLETPNLPMPILLERGLKSSSPMRITSLATT